MSHQQSVGAECLEYVIAERSVIAKRTLKEYMSDTDLVQFGAHVNKLLDLVDEEIDRRRAARRQSTPAADTGEINIIRGTG